MPQVKNMRPGDFKTEFQPSAHLIQADYREGANHCKPRHDRKEQLHSIAGEANADDRVERVNQADENEGCRDRQEIGDTFSQSVFEVCWPDPMHDGIGRCVWAANYMEIRHERSS
jgi:hypothetical protein